MERNTVDLTYQDYLLLPDEPRVELIDGECAMVPAASPSHQDVCKKIGFKLYVALELTGRGKMYFSPIDVVLSEENVLQPDVLFIRANRLQIIEQRCIRGAPDLLVEVMSPGSRNIRRDREIKRELYSRLGVREYWIVDLAARSVEIIVTTVEQTETRRVFTAPATLISPTLPELTIPLDEIFE